MMKAMVTFTKEVEVTVVGESFDEIESAAEAACKSWLADIERDIDWDTRVHLLKKSDDHGAEEMREAARTTYERIRCDCGVVDGKLVNIRDYNKAKGTMVPEPEI